MKKFIKWTAIFVAMFGISTLLSMVASNDVSWTAFTDETNWGVGVLFAPLLTAACWALWPSPTYSPFDGICSRHCDSINPNNWRNDDWATNPFDSHMVGNMYYSPFEDDE